MKSKDFNEFLRENKKKASEAMKEFEKHSKEFDRKVTEILTMM